jgi:hypothetical protein
MSDFSPETRNSARWSSDARLIAGRIRVRGE